MFSRSPSLLVLARLRRLHSYVQPGRLTLQCSMTNWAPMSVNAPRTTPVALVHFALAMGGFAIGTTEFATMSLVPDMARGLGIDEPTAGHVISAYALGVVVGAPLLAVAAAKLRGTPCSLRSWPPSRCSTG
jgi:hypothetical protein